MMKMMLLQVQDLHITKSDEEIGFYAGLLGHHQSSLLSQQLQLNWSEIAVQIQEAGVELSFFFTKKTQTDSIEVSLSGRSNLVVICNLLS